LEAAGDTPSHSRTCEFIELGPLKTMEKAKAAAEQIIRINKGKVNERRDGRILREPPISGIWVQLVLWILNAS
jgi:hypothetical protein